MTLFYNYYYFLWKIDEHTFQPNKTIAISNRVRSQYFTRVKRIFRNFETVLVCPVLFERTFYLFKSPVYYLLASLRDYENLTVAQSNFLRSCVFARNESSCTLMTIYLITVHVSTFFFVFILIKFSAKGDYNN